MVRHEAAEALGAIGTEEAVALLQEYAKDPSRVVKESCVVALDAADYWATLVANGGNMADSDSKEAAADEAEAGAGAGQGAGAGSEAVATA